jgi:dTDP-4-amino-4,6-dideoxygalactose transaminase
LAVFGEDPAFEVPLHVGRPNLGDRRAFRSRVESIFDRKWLSNNGPLVQEFEARLEDITGARHCVAVTNGTVGLELVIRALGLTGEVIVPSYTFIATVHALRWHGLTPVFCDVDPVSHNLDPDRVEALITPKTSAIAAVHLWGRACDTERLQQIADRHGLRLMYDAAHAFGCSRGGQMVGTFGDAEVYSFHATKFVNAFEGGAVATNSDALAETLRSMKNFGFAGYDNVQSLGVNGKMSEVSAAMGLTSLESMEAIIATNRRNYDAYRREIDRVSGLSLIDFDAADRSNYQYVIVEVNADKAGLTRDEIVSVLEAEQVLARRYFYPGCHRMEPYATEQPCVGERLPVTEHLSDAVLALPTGTAVDISHIRAIGGILRAAVSDASRVQSYLRRHGITPH